MRICDQNCEDFSPSTEKVFFDSKSNDRFTHGNAMATWNWMEKLENINGASFWDQEFDFGSIYWKFEDETVKKQVSKKTRPITISERLHFWIFCWF